MVVIPAGDRQIKTLQQFRAALGTAIVGFGRSNVAEGMNNDFFFTQPLRQLEGALAPC